MRVSDVVKNSELLKATKLLPISVKEGFVAVDRIGNALKLVDRLEFSRLNFGSGKPSS